MSAAQLADYLAAPTPLAQMGILRAAKYPGESRPLVIQYQHARRAIANCLISPDRINRIVADTVINLEQRRDDPANRPLIREDARRSIDVIETYQRSANALELDGVRFVAPLQNLPSLMIGGVEVSVFPEAVAYAAARAGERVGSVFVRCAIGGEGDAAANRRAEANRHLATLAHMHTAEHLGNLGTPHAPTSMVIDVPRVRVTRGPANINLRVRNIEAACGMIAAIWPTV